MKIEKIRVTIDPRTLEFVAIVMFVNQKNELCSREFIRCSMFDFDLIIRPVPMNFGEIALKTDTLIEVKEDSLKKQLIDNLSVMFLNVFAQDVKEIRDKQKEYTQTRFYGKWRDAAKLLRELRILQKNIDQKLEDILK